PMDPVGQASKACNAWRRSALEMGWVLTKDVSAASPKTAGAICRQASQSMQVESTKKSPGTFSGTRFLMFAMSEPPSLLSFYPVRLKTGSGRADGPRSAWNMAFSLCQVEQQNFGCNGGLNRYRLLICDGSTIASAEIVSERMHASVKNLEPRRPPMLDLMRNGLSGQQRGQIQAGILMNAQGASGALGRGDQTKPAPLLFLGHVQLLVTWLQSRPLRQQPDLVEMDPFVVGGVELAVPHPRS